jgi:hypothetical protein
MMAGRTLFGFDELATRWSVSLWTLRRAANRSELRTISIGARRLVPLDEVLRVEQVGLSKRQTSGAEAAASAPEVGQA